MSFTPVPTLPALPADGATGDDFNNPAIAFFQAMRDEFGPGLNILAGELNAFAAAFVDAAFSGTSTTSVAIGTGTKTFTTQAGLTFSAGQWIIVASAANPSNYMLGQIEAYGTPGSGSLEITVLGDGVGGSGTHDDWVIGLVPKPISRVRSEAQTSFTSPLAFNSDNYDIYSASAQAANLTINADAGTPVNGRKVVFPLTCDGTPRTITFTGAVSKGFIPIGVGLGISGDDFTYVLEANKTTIFGLIYIDHLARWAITGFSQEA